MCYSLYKTCLAMVDEVKMMAQILIAFVNSSHLQRHFALVIMTIPLSAFMP